MTGKCTKGVDCHLQHRSGKSRKRTNSTGRPPKGLQGKRRRSDQGGNQGNSGGVYKDGGTKADGNGGPDASDANSQSKSKGTFLCFEVKGMINVKTRREPMILILYSSKA